MSRKKRMWYPGALVVRRRQNITYGKRIIRYLQETDHIITEQAHEANVSHQEYEQAQLVINKQSRDCIRN